MSHLLVSWGDSFLLSNYVTSDLWVIVRTFYYFGNDFLAPPRRLSTTQCNWSELHVNFYKALIRTIHIQLQLTVYHRSSRLLRPLLCLLASGHSLTVITCNAMFDTMTPDSSSRHFFTSFILSRQLKYEYYFFANYDNAAGFRSSSRHTVRNGQEKEKSRCYGRHVIALGNETLVRVH